MLYDPPKPTVKLMVEIGMPAPHPDGPRPMPEKSKKVPIEEQVRAALKKIDSHDESHLEWAMINKLYASLKKMKKNQRIRALIKMIEPVMAKYGQYQVAEKE